MASVHEKSGAHGSEHRYHQTNIEEQGGDVGIDRNGSFDADEQDTLDAPVDDAALAAALAGDGDGDHFGQGGCSVADEGVGRTLVVGPGSHQFEQHHQI